MMIVLNKIIKIGRMKKIYGDLYRARDLFQSFILRHLSRLGINEGRGNTNFSYQGLFLGQILNKQKDTPVCYDENGLGIKVQHIISILICLL